MKIYRSVWILSWALIATFGAALSTTMFPPTGLIILVLLGSVAGLLTLALSRRGGNHNRQGQTLDTVLSAAGTRAGMGAASMLAVVGLSAFIGSFTVFLAILAAVTSPRALSLITVRIGTQPAPTEPVLREEATDVEPETMDPAVSLRELTYEDLCRTWRSTYVPVRVASDATSLENLSALRRACLDELERRDPAAFNSWLGSQPRAAGTPKKLLDDSRRGDPNPDSPQ